MKTQLFCCLFLTELTTPTNGVCNDGEIQSYAYCSSSDKDYGTVVSCPVAGISGITVITSFTLDQQNKTEACVPDDTYGQFGADRVWVRNGCDAVFIVCGEGTATTISETETTSVTSIAAHTTSITGMIYYSKLISIIISIMLLCPKCILRQLCFSTKRYMRLRVKAVQSTINIPLVCYYCRRILFNIYNAIL